MKTYSLRRRLLKSISIPLVMYITVIAIIAYFSTREEIKDVYDSQLITAANVLWFLSQDELKKNPDQSQSIDIDDLHLSDEDKDAFDEYADLRMFRVWKDNNLFLYSENSIKKDYPPFAKGFGNFKFDHAKWRVYSMHVPSQNVIVEVAENMEARNDLVINLIIDFILPFVVLLPLMIFLLARALRYGLQGMKKVTREVARRSPSDMSPLGIEQIPSDLAPLTRAIDSLFLKMKITLKREREFIDDAAHSLKTPLAAMKIQAQLISRLKTQKEREEALKDLLKATDRASRLVEQLLISSRIENDKFDLNKISLKNSLDNSVRLIKPVAAKASVKIEMDETENSLMIDGNDELLSILFTNILDNAVKYSPAKGKVKVHLYRAADKAVVEISDNGPGVKPEEKLKIFERFNQAQKHQKSGNGLGLSIARQIVELLQGSIKMLDSEDKKGATIRIMFKIV